MKKEIKLAIVDDQHLFRKGIVSLIREEEGINVVLEASNGKELIDQLETIMPDIVLLDLEMPVMDGIFTTEVLHKKYPEIRVIILTMHNEDEFIIHLIEKGASGFLLKNHDIETVIDAIYAVSHTGFYFNEHISKAMVKGLIQNQKINPTFNRVNFSEREIEIIRLLCKEYTSKEIADEMYVSIRTVEGHKDRIMHKIGARNSIGIVMYAVKNNLIK
jgi:two-component system, NarL family, response regulator DegU